MESYCLMGMKFQFGTTKKFWTWMVTLVAYNVNELNVTMIQSQMAKMVKYMLCICIFYQIFFKIVIHSSNEMDETGAHYTE